MASAVTIQPTVGNAPFLTAGGVGDPNTGAGYAAIDVRRAWSRTYTEGVLSSPAFKVHEAGTPGLAVEVDANVDAAIVEGDLLTDQGLYYVAPHSAVISLDVPAPDTTNPRVDRVILRVYDDDADGSTRNEATVEVLAGAPSAGADLDNGTGAAAVPDTALHLADYVVAPGASAITDGDIRDYRTYGMRDGRVGELRSFACAPDKLDDGWVWADARALNRLVHHRLFDKTGTLHGAGDGSLTFNAPDARGRALFGHTPEHPDMDTVGKSDGAAIANRGARHRHGKGSLSIPSGGSHRHRILLYGAGSAGGPYQVLQYISAGVNNPTYTDTNTPGQPYNENSVHSHPNGEFAGEVGTLSGPLDSPGFLVCTIAVFTGSVAE